MRKRIAMLLTVLLVMGSWMGVFAEEDITVFLDGTQIQFDVAPVIMEDRTMVPVSYTHLDVYKRQDYNTVIAVPYDMLISGYDTKAVNELVLWSAKSPSRLDMDLFSRGEYVRSMEKNALAESISKVLYPADDHYKGNELSLIPT